MHEFGLMQSVLDSVGSAAKDAGARRVSRISLVIGDMSEVVNDALEFAFEALSPGTLADGAELLITNVKPRSRCSVCGAEFEHDRYHWGCPQCQSLATELLAGKELHIDSIEVEEDD
jgi:hydrogenase nickel incorporation protein HypA/HybF